MAEHIAWKSFTAHAPLSDAEMQSPALVGRVVEFARAALPLLEWGWAVVDNQAPTAVPILRHLTTAAKAGLLADGVVPARADTGHRWSPRLCCFSTPGHHRPAEDSVE